MAWGTITRPTPAKLSASEADSLAGSTHAAGAQYEPRTISRNSTPYTDNQRMVREEHLINERLRTFVLNLAVEWVSGLNIGVHPGVYRTSAGTLTYFSGSASYALDDNTTDQMIWLDVATNAVDHGTSWPGTLTDFVPLAMVDTASGTVLPATLRDYRPALGLQIQASTTSPTGTTGTTFTLDSDNSGAGAEQQQLAFNRGSTVPGDAALEWDEANDQFNLLDETIEDSTANLNVAGLLIDGTSMVTSNGAAKAAAAVAGDGLAHSAGVLSVDVDDSTIEIASGTGEVQIKDGGITTSKLGDTLADKLVQVSIPDGSGASPVSVTVQVKDIQGNDLDEEVVLEIGVWDDQWGATAAVNATIAVGGGAGTKIADIVATKRLLCRTNSSGELQITVTDGTAETVYLLAAAARRSRMLDCADIGTITIS